jgi:hypothetical protein
MFAFLVRGVEVVYLKRGHASGKRKTYSGIKHNAMNSKYRNPSLCEFLGTRLPLTQLLWHSITLACLDVWEKLQEYQEYSTGVHFFDQTDRPFRIINE